MQRLKMQDKQIADLQEELMKMKRMERNIRINSNLYRNYMDIFNSRELKTIQKVSPSNWPLSIKEKFKELNMIDSDGDLTSDGLNFLRNILE